MSLEKLRKEIYKCISCGICSRAYWDGINVYGVCPALEIGGFESYGARGKIIIAKNLLNGQLSYDSKLVNRIYQCLLCGHCKIVCPLEVDTISIIEAMRREIVRKGLEPEPLREIDRNVREKHNVFGEDEEKRSEWARNLDLPEKGDVVYFAGCYYSYRYPEEAAATGVPVIASDRVPFVTEYLVGCDKRDIQIGTLPTDKIIIGESAIVVNAGDVRGFAYAMELLLKDEDLRASLGRKAHSITIPYFTWENVVKSFLNIVRF